MRIEGYEKNRNSVNFGYNKRLNRMLQRTLEKSPGILFEEIAKLNKTCNRLEETIGKPTTSLLEKGPLVDMFVGLKRELTEWVENFFPSLRFLQREHDTYLKESERAPWKQEVLDMLKELMYDAREDFEGTISTATNPVSESGNKIIREFSPNAQSPKGFENIGGMEALKQDLYDKIIFPIKNPEQAAIDTAEYGITFPRATLLHGPPGCGKTFIAEAVAREAGVPFFKFKISELGCQYINQTSINYEKAFEAVAQKAKETKKPCILFIDELEGLTKVRDSLDNADDMKQMGTLLDLINIARERKIIIIGASNKYDLVDEAIRNRFDNQVFIGMPDLSTRVQVLRKSLEKCTKAAALLASEDELNQIAKLMDGFSNRTVVDLSNKASLIAKRDSRRDITVQDFTKAIAGSSDLRIKDGDRGYKPNNRPPIGFSSPA